MKTSSVYLIKCQDFLKIGKTHDLKQRMRQYMVYNPLFSVIGEVKCDRSSSGRLEYDAKTLFKEHHIRGEWFSFDQSILDYFYKQENYIHYGSLIYSNGKTISSKNGQFKFDLNLIPKDIPQVVGMF